MLTLAGICRQAFGTIELSERSGGDSHKVTLLTASVLLYTPHWEASAPQRSCAAPALDG